MVANVSYPEFIPNQVLTSTQLNDLRRRVIYDPSGAIRPWGTSGFT